MSSNRKTVNEQKIRLAIADDHSVLVDGYVSLLQNHSRIKLVATASNVKKLMEHLATRKLDVVLLDIEMPEMNGMETLIEIRKHYREIKVIIITTFYHNSFMAAYAKAGANAFLSKTCKFAEVEETILKVHSNGNYFNKEVTLVLDRIAKAEKDEKGSLDEVNNLTELELNIIRQICNQKTSQQIGDELSIPKRRIDYYRQRIMQKLNIDNLSALIMFAVNNRLL